MKMLQLSKAMEEVEQKKVSDDNAVTEPQRMSAQAKYKRKHVEREALFITTVDLLSRT